MSGKKTDFDRVNKINIMVSSLRNQLKHCSTIDEMNIVAANIISLEHQCALEKIGDCQELEQERHRAQARVDKLRNELLTAENELLLVSKKINTKISIHLKSMQKNVDRIERDYFSAVETTET